MELTNKQIHEGFNNANTEYAYQNKRRLTLKSALMNIKKREVANGFIDELSRIDNKLSNIVLLQSSLLLEKKRRELD